MLVIEVMFFGIFFIINLNFKLTKISFACIFANIEFYFVCNNYNFEYK